MKAVLVLFFIASFIGFCRSDEYVVWSVATSNRLETWEGRYALSDMFTISSSNFCQGFTFYSCLYQHKNWVKNSSRKSGTLFEMYGSISGKVCKVLSANENVKGVTPVLLKIGIDIINYTDILCLHWRYQGNGGLQRFDQYVFTNNVFSLLRQFEYCDQGNGMQWYELQDGTLDLKFRSSQGIDFKSETIVWENTNTIYHVNGSSI